MDDSNATARLEMAKMTLDGLRTCETSLWQQFGGEIHKSDLELRVVKEQVKVRFTLRHAQTCVKSLVQAIAGCQPQLAQDAVSWQTPQMRRDCQLSELFGYFYNRDRLEAWALMQQLGYKNHPESKVHMDSHKDEVGNPATGLPL